jgi:hypothetical protein
MLRTYVLIILTPLYVFALSPDLKNDYTKFKKKYSELLTKSTDQKAFLSSFAKDYKTLQTEFEKFSKDEKEEISKEGNQMALDIEMLEPLEFLASSKISNESCAEAELLNEMNSSSDVKTFQKVKESLRKLCSKL